jgi:hypothetical protein
MKVEDLHSGERKMKMIHVVAIAMSMALGANLAVADPPGEPSKTKPAPPAAGQAAMKAYVDPETGQLTSRPATQADADALNAPFQDDPGKVQEIRKADGSTEWILNGQADSALIATRGTDGKLEIACAEHGVVDEHAKAPAEKGGRDER